MTDSNGTVVSTIDLDPWGGETSKSSNQAFAPHRYTSYERDGNGRDQAGARQYHGWFSRFDQPDPYRGSYDLADPQSFNRYSYVQNDPVNFVDPTGLGRTCIYFVEGEFTTGYDSHHSQAYEYGFGFCFDNSLFSRTLPGGGDNDSQSQIPAPPIDRLLQNERCRKFLYALLGKLKDITGRAPYKDNFRDLYTAASGGFYDGRLKEGYLGEAHGNVGGPSLQIILDTSQADANGINALEYTAIHEVIHVAAPMGYNGHDVMAQAAWAVGTAQGLLGRFPNSGFAGGPKKKDEAGANGYNSELFEQVLYAACGPK